MKILMLLALISCASHHNEKRAEQMKVALTKDMSYETAAKTRGALGKCVEFEQDRYCKWSDGPIAYFKSDKYVKDMTPKVSPLVLNMNIVSLKGEQVEKIASLNPNKERNAQGLEWRRYQPMLGHMLSHAGYTMTQDPAAVKQMVVVEFSARPVSKTQGSHQLVVSSFANNAGTRGNELWKIELSSVSSARDLRPVMPILTAVAHALIKANEEVNEQRNVSENDIEVVAFTDHLSRKK